MQADGAVYVEYGVCMTSRHRCRASSSVGEHMAGTVCSSNIVLGTWPSAPQQKEILVIICLAYADEQENRVMGSVAKSLHGGNTFYLSFLQKVLPEVCA